MCSCSVQFTLQNGSADVIEVDWKWIQIGSVISHRMQIESGLWCGHIIIVPCVSLNVHQCSVRACVRIVTRI